LARFRDNLALPVDDERRRFLFSIHGVGGVGKTFLLGHLRRVATEAGWATALAGDDVFDVPETLATLAEQLGGQGVRLKRFGQRYAGYRKRAAGESPAAEHGSEEGPASLVTQTAVRMGLGAARTIPGGGLVADAVKADDVAKQIDHMRMAAKERLRHHDAGLSSPAEELTKAFIESLAQAGRPIALFFDTYERTAVFLDAWLRTVFEQLPPNMVVTVAGRHPLDSSLWSGYLSVLEELPLSVFTDVEARQLLAQVAVTDEQVVDAIVQVSGGLPLAVAMHAANRPAALSALPDVTGSLVERFLQWENNPTMRNIAVAAALPRWLDRDVLAAVLDPASAGPDDAYTWLSRQAFVTRDAGRLLYHDIVREAMLRLSRTYSVSQWRERHDRIAGTYQRLREGLGAEDGWSQAAWQSAMLEETYHRLCADPAGALPEALHGAVSACAESLALAARWADALTEAGHDAGDEAVESLGERLAQALRADSGGAVAYLDSVLRHPRFPEAARAKAYEERGDRNRMADDHQEALVDFGHALALDPEASGAMAGRGETYRLMGRYDEALTDFDRAIEIRPDFAWAIGSRGQTYQQLKRYDDAATDLTRAIELNPDYAWAIGSRGQTYQQLKRYDDALADFNRATDIDPAYTWAIAERGETYQQMDRYDEALADLSRAIELKPTYAWAIGSRGLTYRQMDRYDEALADFDRAIDIDPTYAWAIAERGQTYRQLKRYDEALTDLTRAIEINPAYTWAITERGEVYRLMKRYDEALTDFDRAIEINPAHAWAIGCRGQTYQHLKRYDDALTDLDHAIGLESGIAWLFIERGRTHRMLKRDDDAIADLDRAIDIDPENEWAIAERGETYRLMKRYAEALADFDRAVELNSGEAEDFAGRARTHRALGHDAEALADFDRAIALDPDESAYASERAEISQQRP
ncbi:MAG: tetratricopeptide repeat protein, partial [Actinomadura sp.]